MATNVKMEDLKALFETGKIPTGEHYAQFIEFAYNLIEPTTFDTPPTDDDAYPDGVSYFIDECDLNGKHSDWCEAIEALLGEQPDRFMVRTIKDSSKNLCVQEVDALENGVFKAQYSRTQINGQFTELKKIVSEEFVGEVPEKQIYTYTPPNDGQTHGTFYFEIPDFNDKTDYVLFRSIDYSNFDYSYDQNTGILTLNTYSSGTGARYPGYATVYIFKNKYVPRMTATVLDQLTSDSATDALSAKAGKSLNLGLTEVRGTVASHIDTVADTENFGHVKVDGITITSNEGVISAVGGGGDSATPLSDDYLLDNSAIAASTKATKGLYDAISSDITTLSNRTNTIEENVNGVYGITSSNTERININDSLISDLRNDLTEQSNKVASNTQLGQVKVDGITITASSDGVITAVGGGGGDISDHVNKAAAPGVLGHVIPDNITIVSDVNGVITAIQVPPLDLLTSDSPINTLSANQGRVLNEKITTHSNLVANSNQFGHVKVDNDTIRINAQGVIRAVHPNYQVERVEVVLTLPANSTEVIYDSTVGDIYNDYKWHAFVDGLAISQAEYSVSSDPLGLKFTLYNNNSEKKILVIGERLVIF